MDKLKLPEKNTEDAVTPDKNQKARRFSLMDEDVYKRQIMDCIEFLIDVQALSAFVMELPISKVFCLPELCGSRKSAKGTLLR